VPEKVFQGVREKIPDNNQAPVLGHNFHREFFCHFSAYL
jgi:hypothetical protein